MELKIKHCANLIKDFSTLVMDEGIRNSVVRSVHQSFRLGDYGIKVEDLINLRCRDYSPIFGDYYTILEMVSMLRRKKADMKAIIETLAAYPPDSLESLHDTFPQNIAKYEAIAEEIKLSQTKRIGVKRDVKCALCGADNWFLTEKQTSRADEPMKSFPECLDCHPI